MLRYLLFPFSVLYHLITALRNHLFNIGYSRSISYTIPLINVGNLSVGGTGKSPMVEYLIRLFSADYKISTLSRGYGRKTRGFRLATPEDDAATLGDEPFQFYNKFGSICQVAVGEERSLAIPEILYNQPDTNLIILDDAYQHRTVNAPINILLTQYSNPFYQDYLLPMGRLRESRKGADRAEVVVVTKCPDDLSPARQSKITKEIKVYTRSETPIFFTSIKYQAPVSVFDKKQINKKVLLVTGIANTTHLVDHVRGFYDLVDHMVFPDHYAYKEKDFVVIKEKWQSFGEGVSLITTEKDMVRMIQPSLKTLFSALPIFYIPIEIYFLSDKDRFDRLIKESVGRIPNESEAF